MGGSRQFPWIRVGEIKKQACSAHSAVLGTVVGCTYSFSKHPPSWCDQLEYILWRIRFTDLV